MSGKRILAAAAVALGLTWWFVWRRPASTDVAALHSKFAESMTGVTLVGRSTTWNREGLSGEERYHIDGVTHVSGDTWLLRTRLNYSGREIPAPIPVPVKWAGDTPVITLTDVAIPGVGTFTARVVLYGDQYAGTWSGHGSGGQVFGKIVRNP